MKYLPALLRPPYHFLAYNLLYRYRLNRTVRTTVGGIELAIEPSVMHPKVFKSGKVFAEYIATCDIHGKSILDVGTGSGILAIMGAQRGAQVVATDINPLALTCAKANVLRNGCASSVMVLESDLFVSLGGKRFDMILFNPPYLVRAPKGPYATAMDGGVDLALIKRFAADASNHLSGNGFMLLLLSTDAPMASLISLFSAAGFSIDVVHRRSGLFEEFLVCRITPQQSLRHDKART
jgi:release factor glutamine methyltransferase